MREDLALARGLKKYPNLTKQPNKTKAYRKFKSLEAAEERRARRAALVAPPTARVVHGDFRKVMKTIAAESVDAIICDPPYPAEFIPLYSALGAHAARLLKPGGILAAMCGNMYWPKVFEQMEPFLEYYWPICYLTPGAAPSIRSRQVNSNWKPVLVFVKGTYTGETFGDVIRSEAREKQEQDGDANAPGDWQQSESGMISLVKALTEKGAMVVDPFAGWGSTGVACVLTSRNFQGIELDKARAEEANRRIAEAHGG